MPGKNQPILPASMVTTQDILAWYLANPFDIGPILNFFPLEETDQDTWKTVSNKEYQRNIAADPIDDESSVPVAGRESYKSVLGSMTSFGKGREMTARDVKKFKLLEKNFQTTKNPADAQKLIDFYGADLEFVRKAIYVQMIYLCWALLSNACDFEFLAANSPYFAGLSAVSYPIEAWQKNEVGTAWSDPAADILADIKSVLDTAEQYGIYYTEIKINKKWFDYVRMNDGIKTQTITLIASLTGAQTNPTLEEINAMLGTYFNQDVKFVVIDEKSTRESVDGVKTTSNPFKDGVAVFTEATQVGRFEWKKLDIVSDDLEQYEDLFVVGRYANVDPNYEKTYSKSQGFPVVDSYAENFYLKIDAVAWP